MGKQYHCQHEKEEEHRNMENQKIQYEFSEENLIHSKAAKELGIMENKVIADIAFHEVESDRMALMNSTKSVSKFFKSKMQNKGLNNNKSNDYTMDGLNKILGQVRCELCNRFFKNIRGVTVHKYKMHTKTDIEKFNKLKALENTDINTVPVGDPSRDVIMPTFVENNAISLLKENRRLFLRRRLHAQTEVKGEGRVIAAESIRTWSATESSFVKLNVLSDNVLLASNIPQHFSRTPDEQKVNKMKCNITESVVIYHQSLCSDSENKSQSLTIEEVGDSTSEHNMTDATYIDKKETFFPAKEPYNSKLNEVHTAITDFTKENVISETSSLNSEPLSDAVSSLKTRKCRNTNKRLCYMKYYLKRRIANSIKEENICPHDNSRNPGATTSKAENIANSENTKQIPKHSESDIKPEKVKNVSANFEKLKISKQGRNNNKLCIVENLKIPLNEKTVREVKNTRSVAKREAAINEQEMPNSVIPHEHKAPKRIKKSKASQRINFKKKKAYVLKLGSQKYYLVKRKRLRICTLIGKHKPRIWTRIKKKHKKKTSNICSNIVVEDLTEEIEDIVNKSKTDNTEQSSRTSTVRPNCNNLKDLKIPLIRVDHIPSSELTKLIKKSDGTENFNGKAKTGKRGRPRKIRRSKIISADNEKHDCPIYKSGVNGEEVEESRNGEDESTIPSVVNEKDVGASKAVLHTEEDSAIQGLWSELHQQEDRLPCETQDETSLEAEAIGSEVIVTKEKRAISIIENVKLDKVYNVKKDSTLLKARKHNSKRKMEALNENISKKLKLNGMLKLGTKAQSDSIAKPENRMKLNKEIISMTKENICYVCDKNFSTRKALSEHMFFIHDAGFDNPIVFELLHNHVKKNSLPDRAEEVCEETACNESQNDEDQFENFTEEEDDTDEVPYHDTPYLANESMKGSRKWRCRMCKENFGLLRNYLRHKYYSHNDETVVHICDNCTKVLTSVAMVNVHVCTNVTSWICRRCNLEFPNGISLGRHNINRHLEVVGPHTCNTCDLTFLTNYMLERHSSMHHNFINGIDKTNSTSCEDGTSTAEFFQIKEKQPFHIRRAFWLPNKEEVENYVSDSMLTSLRRKNQCRCMICNEIYPTKLLTKLHLEKQHKICMDICQLCNGFFLAGKVVCHLIDRHIISDNLVLRGGEVNDKIKFETMEDAQYDLTKVLGLKRLADIYSYQRFNNTMQKGQYNCHVCLRKFLTNQEYKLHYLTEHDTVCILCNVGFENSVKAMDHKLNNHTSAVAYLWAIQSIVTSLLTLEKQGSMIAAVADKLREMRICDCEGNSATSEKCRHKDHFASTFKTEILEVAAQYKNVTLSMRVECEENVSKPSTSQVRSNAPINEADRGMFEPCTSRASQSVSSSNSVSVILVTEEDLWLYKDNIKALASKLCSSCTMYSEEYITVLLTNYVQSLAGNNNT